MPADAPAPRVQRAAAGRTWRWLRRIALTLLVLYVIWVLLITLAQRVLIFPGYYFLDAAVPAPPGVQVHEVAHAGGSLVLWYAPGAGRSAASPGPACLYVHGNLEVNGERWPQLAAYLPRGVSLLALEYRGYPGGGPGEPSEAALRDDARAAYDWLAQRPEVDPQRIIFQGQSLGGGVLLGLSQERVPAAVVLTCTAFSVQARAAELGIPAVLCRQPFRNDLAIARLVAPVLIFHGREDFTMPVSHGRRLAAAAPRATLIESDDDHRSLRPDWEQVWRFLEQQRILPAE